MTSPALLFSFSFPFSLPHITSIFFSSVQCSSHKNSATNTNAERMTNFQARGCHCILRIRIPGPFLGLTSPSPHWARLGLGIKADSLTGHHDSPVVHPPLTHLEWTEGKALARLQLRDQHSGRTSHSFQRQKSLNINKEGRRIA